MTDPVGTCGVASTPDSALGKVMLILDAFTAEDRGLRFTELVHRTGLSKSTLHRVLAGLEAQRLLDRHGGLFHLGGHLFELGMRTSAGSDLLEVATPHLEELSNRTRELVHLGVLDGTEVLYVAKLGGHRQVRAPSRLGGRMPLHATAIGKVLLAHADRSLVELLLAGPLPRLTSRTLTAAGQLRRQVDDARRRGVALEFEESAPGIACVAAPVLAEGGLLVAAVSVTGPITRFKPQRHAAAVAAAGREIGRDLASRSLAS